MDALQAELDSGAAAHEQQAHQFMDRIQKSRMCLLMMYAVPAHLDRFTPEPATSEIESTNHIC